MQRATVIYGICFTPTHNGALGCPIWSTLRSRRSWAEVHGWPPEACNCDAPDTGNMEVLTRFGSDEHKEQWLKTLPEGTIRSAFATTEPRHPDTSPPTRSGGNRDWASLSRLLFGPGGRTRTGLLHLAGQTVQRLIHPRT